jgi:UDPglucose--hexose-1-phosphate uridylyltransferase
VVPNKFGALTDEGTPQRREEGPLFREMTGVGHHEVIIETPVHNRPLPLMTDTEVAQVLGVYQARYHTLREDPRVRCIVLFKNHGERAGTSLMHPHAQLVAMPVAPMQMRRKYAVAIGHYDDTGRCLYYDLVQAEVQAKVRLVLATDRFVVFHPFASRVPFETWIVPTQHQPSFGQVSPADLTALAQVLRRTLRTLYDVLSDPDFNFIIHTAPLEDEAKPYYLWHLQIVPRVTIIAGFELGSGMWITTMLPEESATIMRDVMQQDNRGGR